MTEVFNTYEQRVLVIAGAGGSSLELLGNPPVSIRLPLNKTQSAVCKVNVVADC